MCVSFIFSNDSISLDENKIGLVLSGGGAKGFAHIGLLKVLDEEHIPIDYIVGTSMGSIIGAMYSMGYSGKEIEEFVLNEDWMDYFNDDITRTNEMIENKVTADRYITTFPIKNNKFYIPKGVVKGQKINQLLNKVFINSSDISDFSQLPIPFACVSTDAESGEAVVLKEGSLSEAVRASISLPGILDPVNLNGQLLLDGGLSNNFPVSVAKDFGASVVIGSQVLEGLYNKEKLDSAVLIMNQAIAYKRIDITNNETKKVDILVSPQLDDYNIFSYTKIKEIIEEGEKAARAQITELKKLKNEEKYKKIKLKSIKENRKFHISKLLINNATSMNSKIIENTLKLELPVELTKSDINSLITKLYSLRIFSKVNYRLINNALVIDVEEKIDRYVNVGFNYNDSTKGDLFMKFTDERQNFIGNKTEAELLLGDDKFARIENTWYLSPFKSLGYYLGMNWSTINNYNVMINRTGVLDFDINLMNYDFGLKTYFSNSKNLGIGVKNEYVNIKSNTATSYKELEDYKNRYTIAYLSFTLDSLDNVYFPKSGVYIDGAINYLITERPLKLDFSSYNIKMNKPIHLSSKSYLNVGLEKKHINVNNISPIYIPSLGGVYNRQNSINFWGLNPSEFLSNDITSIYNEWFYEYNPNKYIIFRVNEALLKPNSVFQEKEIFGGGIGIAIKTAIGPLQFIISKSDREDWLGYLNIGYNF